jgi:predicted permease
MVSAVAIASLALGIGATSAVFSVVNTVLVKPVPYPEPERLVLLGYTFSGVSVPRFSETKLNVLMERVASLVHIAAFRDRRVNVIDGDHAERVPALQAHANYFTLFGARVALGRLFTAAEDRPGGDRVVLLSEGYWKRRFGADPDVVGRRLTVDQEIVTIVGVLDASVDTTIFNVAPDLWIPLRLDPNSTEDPPFLIAAARLTPGATIALAQAQARLAGDEFHRRSPHASGPSDTFTVEPFHDALVRDVRATLLALVGAVAFVLLIACANVANLMLIRGSVRQREITIRTAIGASRWHIVRQLVIESLMLAFIGGGVGLAIGEAVIRMLLALNPSDVPRIGPHGGGVTLDWRVLSFTFGIATMTGLACGVSPALRLSRGDRPFQLESGRRSGVTVKERRVRGWLIVGEMALALVLLVGATLLIRTLLALHRVDRGFNPTGIITLRVGSTDRVTTTAGIDQLVRTTRQRLMTLPGVISAAATRTRPLESDWRTTVQIGNRPVTDAAPMIVSYRIVSPEYFTVLDIPVLRGRPFTDADGPDALPVAMINQALARRLWPAGSPLDDRIIAFPGQLPEDEPVRQIVGIVGNVRDGMPLEPEEPSIVYVPLAQLLDRETASQAGDSLAWLVQTQGPTETLARSIEREIRQASGNAPITDSRSMRVLAEEAFAPTTFGMTVLILFGGSGLLLASIGLYAVIAYAVEQRAHEIAVRLAVGARWFQIRNMVLLDGLKLASYGTVLGVAVSTALSRALTAFLFGVTPHDLLTFTAAPFFLCVVAGAAVWIPARRASQIDPAEVLRRQ